MHVQNRVLALRLSLISFALLCIFVSVSRAADAPAAGTEIIVAPDGKPDNLGTFESPLNITNVLNGTHPVAPGTTIRLRGGTYRRPDRSFEVYGYTVKLTGAEGRRITLAPYRNERAIIDGGLDFREPTAWIDVRDLEFIASEVVEWDGKTPYAGPGVGLHIHDADHSRFINLDIHHNWQGVAWWWLSEDSELVGCLIHDNGLKNARTGHAVYTQNKDGVKRIADNIIFSNFGWQMHAYGSRRAFVWNYTLEGNIAFNPLGHGSFLIGGVGPSQGIVARDNILHRAQLRLGYASKESKDITVTGNTVMRASLDVYGFADVTEKDNFVWLEKNPSRVGPDPRPAAIQTVLRPNPYDADRANLCIINWPMAKQASLELGAFLKPGDAFRLMNPWDVRGKPAFEGVWQGEAIPMDIASTELNWQGEFLVYVLLRMPRE